MHSRALLFSTIILFGLSTAYPAASQNPQDRGKDQQTRPAPAARPGGGGSNNRPQLSRPNPGGPQVQPARPNPGGGNNRPQPGRPNPGNGNNRPQPSRPQPGRPQPSRPNPGRPNPGNGNNRPQPGRPQPGRPSQGRPPQWGHRPTQRPSYSFRSNDRSYLHRYYQNRFGAINRANRPRFIIGGFFPFAYIPYIQPLPPDVYGYLPPPPHGYSMGYYQGYVVVYDPITYFIANVIDILQ
jgi:hypothetical protein